MSRIPDTKDRAAIILAGGDGTRLRELTRKILGKEVPKQFCPVIGEATLLEQTRKRVSLAVAPDKTIAVVTRPHERFYAPLLADIPLQSLVVQPDNRGTVTAILYSLFRLAEIVPNAAVALIPSDHYVDDDAAFMRHIDLAFEAVDARPELTVLLGITPDRPEAGYGWIEPAQPLTLEHAAIFRVSRFWEKPSRGLAQGLLDRGCLWNSFVVVARLSTLLGLIMMALPRLYLSFAEVRPTLGTVFEDQTIRRLYADVAAADFCAQVLAKFPVNLAVLPVVGVSWSDLGEPRRVMETLASIGVRPQWAAA
jgi:mannose-1-phosphate guanylyltransferase